MLRRSLLLFLALAVPAPASAATFGETPATALRGDQYCLRATDTPGEVAVPVLNGIRFLQATKDGLQTVQDAQIGAGFRCRTVATRPSGAGVIVGQSSGNVLMAVVRDPGGAWSAPLSIDAGSVDDVAAAVSDRGDVIIAVKEYLGHDRWRFRVTRRAPAGTLSPLVPLGPTTPNLGTIRVGAAATGEAFALYSASTASKAPSRIPLQVAIAPPGGGFGAPAHLLDTRLFAFPSLTVAQDGRAVVAASDAARVQVFERAPGAAFGAPVTVGTVTGSWASATAARIGAHGEAAVAWATGLTPDLQVATRPAVGAFSPPVTALSDIADVPAGYDPFYSSETFFESFGPLGGVFSRGDANHLITLTGDGRAIVAIGGGTDLWSPKAVGVATVALAGGTVEGQFLPGAASNVAPVVLADETPAVVWTEGSSQDRFRVHLATAATVETPDPPAPRVTVGAPAKRALTEERPLRLPITCSGPCEVRGAISAGALPINGSLHLSEAGTGTLRIAGAFIAAATKPGPLRVTLAYGAPGARRLVVRTVTVRDVFRTGDPLPRATGVKAVRRGDRIVVTWRMTGQLDAVVRLRRRRARRPGRATDDPRVVAGHKGKRSYRVSLPAKGVNWVTLRVPLYFSAGQKVVVRVRRAALCWRSRAASASAPVRRGARAVVEAGCLGRQAARRMPVGAVRAGEPQRLHARREAPLDETARRSDASERRRRADRREAGLVASDPRPGRTWSAPARSGRRQRVVERRKEVALLEAET